MEPKRTKEYSHGLEEHYHVFWDECKSIHSEHDLSDHQEAEAKAKELEGDLDNDDIEWLTDIGFACVIMKYKNDDEIDPDDNDIQSMTATLTRQQSETVRKRIRSLNETLKRKRKESSFTPRRPDVRDIFPAQPQSSITEEPSEDKAIKQEKTPNNYYYVSLESSSRDDVDRSTTALKSSQDNVFQWEKDADDAKSNEFSPRRLPEMIATMFYTPELEGKDSKKQELMRPPGPKRTQSEGVYQILKTEESEKGESGRTKLDKTVSEGSPVRSLAGKRIFGKSSPQLQRHAKPSRNDNFADSNEIGRIYGVSPQRLEVMRHKSAEDLLKLTKNNNNKEHQPKTPANVDNKVKSNGVTIEGDAKLSFTPDSAANVNSGEAFPPLPNFTLQPEKLGTTRIADLSEPDMVKVRSLALIELTALFDTYSINMSRRKHFSRLKIKESGIFGVPLTSLPNKSKGSKNDTSQAPRFFRDLIAFLETNGLRDEGLLRIPGSQQRVKAIREEIEDSYINDGFFSWQNRKTNDMATILKQFLRELPTPLLSHEYQDTFTAVSDLKDRKIQLQALNLLVLLLPPVHRDTLQVLLRFLSKVIAAESVNKMGLNNVAMIMAPNLFLRANNRANLSEIHKAAATTDIMRMLIKYQNIIWMVPGFMVTQIRYIYEAGSKGRDSKAVKKIIAKRMKSEASPSSTPQPRTKWFGDEIDCGESDYEQIVRVKAPFCKKTCMAVQLTDYMIAADIIARFRSKRKNSVKEYRETNQLSVTEPTTKSRSDSDLDKDDDDTFCLFECGGNIGERCLDVNTNIAALLKANPNGELILKCNPNFA